jgi:hypothetical protein
VAARYWNDSPTLVDAEGRAVSFAFAVCRLVLPRCLDPVGAHAQFIGICIYMGYTLAPLNEADEHSIRD